DNWTFAVAAGEQVRFFILASGSGDIRFDLTGPNGFTAFSGSSTSSSQINLPSDGTYTVTASTVRTPGAYAFRLQQSTVTPLAYNTPYHGDLFASGQSQLFKFTATQTPGAAQDRVSVNLTDVNSQDHNEVYVKFGSPPTRDDFDYPLDFSREA